MYVLQPASSNNFWSDWDPLLFKFGFLTITSSCSQLKLSAKVHIIDKGSHTTTYTNRRKVRTVFVSLELYALAESGPEQGTLTRFKMLIYFILSRQRIGEYNLSCAISCLHQILHAPKCSVFFKNVSSSGNSCKPRKSSPPRFTFLYPGNRSTDVIFFNKRTFTSRWKTFPWLLLGMLYHKSSSLHHKIKFQTMGSP